MYITNKMFTTCKNFLSLVILYATQRHKTSKIQSAKLVLHELQVTLENKEKPTTFPL